nr:putative reverse transcriptase domain-containing protein [Tanacetum cinerariifolium]
MLKHFQECTNHGKPLSPDRVFDFPVDEPERHPASDFFAPGPLPEYAGNPNNKIKWIEADAKMVGPMIGEIAKPIVNMEEQMIALVIDAKEDIAMLFVDDDFSNDDSKRVEKEEVWEVNEEWLMAPVTPSLMPVVPLPSVYEGLEYLLKRPRLWTHIACKEGDLVSDTEVAAGIFIGEIDPRVQQTVTQRDKVIAGLTHQCILGMDKRLADLERRPPDLSSLRELNMRQRRWLELLKDYNTNIQYHPGKANVDRLPQTQRRHNALWVVVDCLTKSAHFIPIRKDYSISRLVEIFQQEIVRLHGTPSAIVSDRDPRFASRFWKGLQKAWGTRLKFSTAFHPQTDGQSELEFAYNNSWHASIKCTPFEMLYGRKCRAPIYWDQVGERVIEGPEMIEVTNAKVAVAK